MWAVPTSPLPAEMVAQLFKRALKRTWPPAHAVHETGSGGMASGAAIRVVFTAGLKVVVQLLVLPRG
jgi:hypothetical protein